MSGSDHNRKRNQTICFRATPEERREIEIKRLRELTEQIPEEQFRDLLQEIKTLLQQLINILNEKR